MTELKKNSMVLRVKSTIKIQFSQFMSIQIEIIINKMIHKSPVHRIHHKKPGLHNPIREVLKEKIVPAENRCSLK